MVIIFTGKTESTEDILRTKFTKLHLDIEAFSSLKYVGVQTVLPPTNFKELQSAIIHELKNTTVRSSRSGRIVFLTLKVIVDQQNNVRYTYFLAEVKNN